MRSKYCARFPGVPCILPRWDLLRCPELKALGSVHFPLRRSSTPSTQLEHAALDDAALSSRGALRQQGSSQRALVKRTAEHFPMSPDPTPKVSNCSQPVTIDTLMALRQPRYLSAALKAIVEYYKATQEGWAFDLTMELNRQGIDWNHVGPPVLNGTSLSSSCSHLPLVYSGE